MAGEVSPRKRLRYTSETLDSCVIDKGAERLDTKRHSVPRINPSGSGSMRRRRREHPQEPLVPISPDAIAITIREAVTLIEILEHAHARIAELSDADEEAIARGSGSSLIPLLYARAGFTSIHGRRNVPLLADEIGLLEAAVINLESYQGNEVALCAGYQLLDDFANRDRNSYPLCRVYGILAFTGEVGDTASGAATPSLT
ncbi:hypothetical protein [Streptomyces sp. Y7]|uniref:hypothetical protein n=1 Tax=Streptomyces sp. Y7 TaxID=3342392 RepID=UPI00371E14B0